MAGTTPHTSTAAALSRFAVIAVACAAAASLWAQTRPEGGLLLDAQTWREEVVTASTGAWPADGWYRLEQRERAIEVRSVRTSEREPEPVAADALYFRFAGTALKTGLRAGYRYPEVLQQPAIGKDHELALGSTRFSLRVDQGTEGTRYVIGYGGQTYTYLLGAPDAHTGVRAVADLDGDQQPDFLVEVDDATMLLLSRHARPGANLPTAQLAGGGC